VITIAKVEACEVLSIPALVEEFSNERERISIFDLDFVETTIIYS
jgi:hypothetical protein